MILVFRILTILIAVMMFGTAANWIIDPTAAALVYASTMQRRPA